jgi:transcription-repair coupling factor (superfamily II helicase)
LDFVATNEAEFARAGEDLVSAFIPVSYINDTILRIQAYRSLAEITSQEAMHRLRRDWRDRFGKAPAAIDNLFILTEIKLAAAKASVSRVEVREGKLMLTRRGDFILVGGKFPRLVGKRFEQLTEVLRLIRTL